MLVRIIILSFSAIGDFDSHNVLSYCNSVNGWVIVKRLNSNIQKAIQKFYFESQLDIWNLEYREKSPFLQRKKPNTNCIRLMLLIWCGWRDSNSHAKHYRLKIARLPIPPQPQLNCIISYIISMSKRKAKRRRLLEF